MVTIEFGGCSTQVPNDKYTSISDVMNDDGLRAFLGFSDNAEAVVNGVAVNEDSAVQADSKIVLVTKANQKA